MLRKKSKSLLSLMIAVLILQVISPALADTPPATDDGKRVLQEAEALIPTSVTLVDEAILTLSKGWSEMSPEERDLFQDIFDPGQTSEIDEDFIRDVLDNFRRIRRQLDGRLNLKYEPDGEMCELMRLYYTDLFTIHICPYFTTEASSGRKARVLIHEVAHMALLVVDRPYYNPKTYSSRYNALTPRGSWLTEIPVLGHIFRELQHSDTLYHPDAYAWFAAALSLGRLASASAPLE
jgi:hypothetical protein